MNSAAPSGNHGREVQSPSGYETMPEPIKTSPDFLRQSLEETALVFGRDKFGCHLIAGLGESEKQIAQAMAKVRAMGGRSHLFAFYPEAGSLLANEDPCPASTFRRVQLARFLLDYDLVGVHDMDFDEHDRLAGYGLVGCVLDELVNSGKPFRTGGYPGNSMDCSCNRSFSDGPTSDIRSYSFRLTDKGAFEARREIATYQELEESVDLKV
ncbi:MAG: hypothetical protein ACYCXF_01450 [Thermoleophilia bacterium]